MKARAALTPVALVVLAAGASAYAYFVDRGTVSDADRAARRSDVFPSFRVDEITRVELVHPGETLVLERDRDAGAGAGAWTITSPRRERADAGTVDALLRELELATRLRDVPAAEAHGLDAPRARATITMGALQYRLLLGADAPRPDGAAYARLDGQGTFVVSRSLKVQLLREADAYRDRALVPYGESEVARVEVAGGPAGGFTLDRNGAVFRLADGLRASRATVDRLFSALADARAESFLADADADRAMSGASPVHVTLVPRDPRRPRLELRVGGQCPDSAEDVVVARLAPTRVSACAAGSLRDALTPARAALVDAAPLFAHADEIDELRLEPAGSSGVRVELARRGTGWHERAPEDRDLSAAESDSAAALALALAQARAIAVEGSTKGAAFVARARVTATRTGSAATEVVEVAAPGTDGTALLRRLDDGALLRMPLAAARRFEPHPVALRAGPVWRMSFDAGAVTAVDDTCAPERERLELHDGVWAMRAPSGFAADAAYTTELARSVAQTKADAWIAEADDGSFGLDAAGACSVTLDLGAYAGARRATISFGAEAGDGGFYARTLDDGAVFVAPATLRELVSHPAIDRSRFRLEPAALRRIAWTGTGRSESLALDGGTDDRLASAVSSLYAQLALHAGPPARDEGLDHPTLELFATSRSDAGASVDTHVTIGSATRIDGMDLFFARVSGVDASFAVPKQAVAAFLSMP